MPQLIELDDRNIFEHAKIDSQDYLILLVFLLIIYINVVNSITNHIMNISYLVEKSSEHSSNYII